MKRRSETREKLSTSNNRMDVKRKSERTRIKRRLIELFLVRKEKSFSQAGELRRVVVEDAFTYHEIFQYDYKVFFYKLIGTQRRKFLLT